MELRLKKLFAVSLLFLTCVASLTAKGTAKGAAPTPLAQFIDTETAKAPFNRALWAITIEDDDGTTLYTRNAHTLVMPASNRKLFSSAAVADCLGLDARIPTELWLDSDGTATDVILKGHGDPSFGGRDAGDGDLVFAPFVASLHERGVTTVRDVVADVSDFDRDTYPGSWNVGDVGTDYAPPVDALAWNENVTGVFIDDPDCTHPSFSADPLFVPVSGSVQCATVGEPTITSDTTNALTVSGFVTHKDAPRSIALVSIHDPALYAAQALRAALARAGITVTGSTRVNVVPRAWHERAAVVQSQPIVYLLTIVLKNSQNLYAEMLLKDLARPVEGETPPVLPATYAAAEAIERGFLVGELGVAPDEFRFRDGSGLSSNDLTTSSSIVKVLRWMNAPERRGIFWSVLATPGEGGTLHKRLLELAPRLRGKTGTISGVNALSGILDRGDGHFRYFSIVVNHHAGESSAATKIIDTIVRELAGTAGGVGWPSLGER